MRTLANSAITGGLCHDAVDTDTKPRAKSKLNGAVKWMRTKQKQLTKQQTCEAGTDQAVHARVANSIHECATI